MEVEFNKEDIFKQAKELIERLDKLCIIYLRVSTKGMGQEERDQLKDILETFGLKLEECILIQAKESAYQLWKQKTRKFNIIGELFQSEDFEDVEKILYVWDLDRIYRNPELQVDFFRMVAKSNGMVLSYRQKYLHQLKEGGAYGKALYSFLIEIFAEQARDESAKRGDRLKKSLTKKEGRLYTNKGNLYGAKLKTVSGKVIKDVKIIDKIERVVFKKVVEGISYRDIIEFMATKNVKISLGYITKLKKKCM